MQTKKKRKKKWILPVSIVAVLIVGFIAARTFLFSAEAETTSVTVQTKKLVKGPLTDSITVSGSVGSNTVKNVYSTLTYQVREIPVEVGDHVKAGDVLLTLDIENLEYDIAQAEINLAAAKSTYSDNTTSNANSIKAAENSVKTAKLSLEKQQLNYDTLVSQSGDSTNSEIVNAKNQIDSAKNTVDSSKTSITTAERSLADANADLETAKQDLVTGNALFEAGLISQSELDTAKDAVTKAQRAVESAQTTLDNAKTSYDTAVQNYDKAVLNSSITQTDVSKNLQTAQKDLESAKLSYQKALDDLAKAKSQSNSNSSIEIQQMNLTKLRDQLEDAVITSPIDGVITKLNAVVGSSPSGILFEVQDLNDLYVTCKIKEANLSKVELGQLVSVTSDAVADQVLTGKVTYISPVASSEAGNTDVEFELKATLDNPDNKIKVGMNAYISIITASADNVYSVPLEALVTEGKNKFVVANDGAYTRIPVTTGLETVSLVEISGDKIRDGLEIVVNSKAVMIQLAAGGTVTQPNASGAPNGFRRGSGESGARPGGDFQGAPPEGASQGGPADGGENRVAGG